MMHRLCCVLLLLAAFGCASPPDEGCQAVPGEDGVDFDCRPSEDSAWQDRTLEEAEEEMDERSPGSRP